MKHRSKKPRKAQKPLVVRAADDNSAQTIEALREKLRKILEEKPVHSGIDWRL